MQPFTDKQIELLKTFADQAVIAIENVRLFQELQTRTRELARSVDELRALGEVGRAVSSTLDVETVLNTIVSRASQLAGADACTIYEYDSDAEEFRLRAAHNADAGFVAATRAVPLRKGEGVMGRAAEVRQPVQVSDITQPAAYQSSLRDALIGAGYRAALPFAERLATHAEDTDALRQSLATFRFATKFLTPEAQPRSQQVLRGIFSPMLDNFGYVIDYLYPGWGRSKDESPRAESRP